MFHTIFIRYWLPVQRVILVWSLQHVHKDGSWRFSWHSHCFLCMHKIKWKIKSFCLYLLQLFFLYLYLGFFSLCVVCECDLWFCYGWNYAVIFPKCGARRDRLWVLGEQNRTTLHFANKCFHRRQGWQRAKNLSLVWSHKRIPQILHSLELVSDCVSTLHSNSRIPFFIFHHLLEIPVI